MELQSVFGGISFPKLGYQTRHHSTSRIGSSSIQFGARYGRPLLGTISNCTFCFDFEVALVNCFMKLFLYFFALFSAGSKNVYRGNELRGLNRGIILRASSSSHHADANLNLSEKKGFGLPATGTFDGGFEPFRGKSGSVSFCGLTHQSVEEGRLVSAPFKEDKGSFLWILGPVVLISSLIVPQFFLGFAIQELLKDVVLVEMVSSLSFEVGFYIALAAFLSITDRMQRPYLEFSSKRWGLITGLRGYLTSAFFTMGFKVIAPLLMVYVTWPVLGVPVAVSVIPYLAGCIAQRVFEANLEKRGSSCWPIVPIIFEVYRLFQLTKAAQFIQKLLFTMQGIPESPELIERVKALISVGVAFQFLGVVCLWSLITFLMRLFPSRPVAENY
ncbi:unnamed protein product [Linum tenue]|uniref:Uncharacterized protein n=1 Tax=Linum tenue TaxID=586396 RepID=A0AAV0P3W1_9ROSI|nr:unnamed protein product [Linum tenue]